MLGRVLSVFDTKVLDVWLREPELDSRWVDGLITDSGQLFGEVLARQKSRVENLYRQWDERLLDKTLTWMSRMRT